ncbi:hypothetical protein [Microcoleus vaginatus]|uniref:hypothetical protein n=1 Tax=Microcoleus vaginatus TaxID=119532 RepID=UPI001684129D|nr:hypothetical protein [Microcoleus sp. FACHB-84]MBD2010555.1 hypothetical protein [Microcoleus sp. FACHB-45]
MQISKKSTRPFNPQDTYPCPVCRTGQISTLALMDALACNFCQHIYTASVERQSLQMADRQPPVTWHWNGKQWIGAHLEGVEFGWPYLAAAIGLIFLPTTLLGLSAYYFPPVPGSRLSWVPVAWTGLAFLSHLGIVLWLVGEFYQFPVVTYFRAWGRRISRR